MFVNNLISIIIINRNGRKFLNGCIDSVKKQSHSKIEIILIDNASTDESLSFVQSNHKDVIIIAKHIIENDPYYNPNLSRDRFDFSLRM